MLRVVVCPPLSGNVPSGLQWADNPPPTTTPVCAPPAFFFPLITAYRSDVRPDRYLLCTALSILCQHAAPSETTPASARKRIICPNGGWHWRCKFVLGVALLLLLTPSSLLLPWYVCLRADFLISAAAVECVDENPRHHSTFIRNVGPHWHSAGGAHVCGCDNHLRGKEE